MWRQCRCARGSIDILVIPSSGDKRSATERRGFASKFKHQLEQLQDSFITYCTAAVELYRKQFACTFVMVREYDLFSRLLATVTRQGELCSMDQCFAASFLTYMGVKSVIYIQFGTHSYTE